jgi:hypothetical protein
VKATVSRNYAANLIVEKDLWVVNTELVRALFWAGDRVRHSIAIHGQQRMCMREKAWLAAIV